MVDPYSNREGEDRHVVQHSNVSDYECGIKQGRLRWQLEPKAEDNTSVRGRA